MAARPPRPGLRVGNPRTRSQRPFWPVYSALRCSFAACGVSSNSSDCRGDMLRSKPSSSMTLASETMSAQWHLEVRAYLSINEPQFNGSTGVR